MKGIFNKIICKLVGHKDVDREIPDSMLGGRIEYIECLRCGRTK